jgi:hypothetical protein
MINVGRYSYAPNSHSRTNFFGRIALGIGDCLHLRRYYTRTRIINLSYAIIVHFGLSLLLYKSAQPTGCAREFFICIAIRAF